MREELLMIPGPTPVPPAVTAAMGKPMISHRGAEFAELYHQIQAGLKMVFQTEEEVLIFPAAGTGAMEAALVNLFSPGERVLSIQNGEFGSRFGKMAQIMGLQVDALVSPVGQGSDLDQVKAMLDQAGSHSYQGILVTHNETSTGVCNDLQVLGDLCRHRDTLLVVDGVSSVGGIPLAMDAWGLDAVVTASQKALMTPPGLAFVAVSQRSWKKNAQASLPRAYWDLAAARAASLKGQTPYTPALSLLYGLAEALQLIQAEGLEARWQRHALFGTAVRAGVQALGLELVAHSAYVSPTVTAFWVPESLGADRLRRHLQQQHQVTVAGGQGELAGKIVRMGHMGHISAVDITRALEALSHTLAVLTGHNEQNHEAVAIARRIMTTEGVNEA